MTDPNESTIVAIRASIEPSNTDAEQSDDMGFEGGPEMIDKNNPVEDEVAAATMDHIA